MLDLRSRSQFMQFPPRGEQYWPRSKVRAGNETIGSLVPKRALDVIEGLGTRLLFGKVLTSVCGVTKFYLLGY